MIRSVVAEPPASPPKRRRTWQTALLAPLLVLATCGPAGESEPRLAALGQARPAVEAAAPAHFADSEFIAADGARLPLRKWLPRGEPRAVILALHGFNDYGNAFDMPGRLWAAHGIATYAYDQRGFGGAPGAGSWPGEGPLAADAIVATRILRATYPGRPLYLLGESMGGALAVLVTTGAMSGLIPGPDGMPTADADGVILSAPAVWGRMTMDFLPRLALFAGVRLFPTMNVSGSGLQIRASDNLPMLQALGRDPLVLKGARIEAVYGLVNLMDSALAAAPRLDAPMLMLYGAHDQVVPARPVADFVAHLPPAPRQPRRLAFYPNGYHLLLRDLGGRIVAEDVASWIFDRGAPLPSQADAQAAVRPWPPAAAQAPPGLAPAGARR